jgi:hypothetical protein
MMGLRFRQMGLNEKPVGQVGHVGHAVSMRVSAVPPPKNVGGTRWDKRRELCARHGTLQICPTSSHPHINKVGHGKPAWMLAVPLVPPVPPKKSCSRIDSPDKARHSRSSTNENGLF